MSEKKIFVRRQKVQILGRRKAASVQYFCGKTPDILR